MSNSSGGGECLHEDVLQEAFHIAFEGEQHLDAKSDEEGSVFNEANIADDAQLLTFSNILAQTQAAAVEAEKRADASKNSRDLTKGTPGEVSVTFVPITDQLLQEENYLSSVYG